MELFAFNFSAFTTPAGILMQLLILGIYVCLAGWVGKPVKW